jgi:hypothetical protein
MGSTPVRFTDHVQADSPTQPGCSNPSPDQPTLKVLKFKIWFLITENPYNYFRLYIFYLSYFTHVSAYKATIRHVTIVLSLSLILRPTVSRPVCLGIKHPSGAYAQIFITVKQLRVCWCGALSLTKGRVCRSQLLLVLASAVIFGSESLGTRDHILLPQIRDFPFRRLLRLLPNVITYNDHIITWTNSLTRDIIRF